MPHVQEIERLIREIEASADPATKAGVRQLVEAILEFHGEAVARMLEIAGETVTRAFAREEAVAAVLLLYGLHPEPVEARVQRAIDGLQGVQLLGIADSVVRVKSTAPRHVVEAALYGAAPEIAAVEIEGPAEPPSFVPVEALFTR